MEDDNNSVVTKVVEKECHTKLSKMASISKFHSSVAGRKKSKPKSSHVLVYCREKQLEETWCFGCHH